MSLGIGQNVFFRCRVVSLLRFARFESVDPFSLYDYGSRAGFWRLHRLLTRHEIPTTVYAVGMALERHPEVLDLDAP